MSSIAAYGSRASVFPGGKIDFSVSYDHGAASPKFTIDFYREGVLEVHIGEQVTDLHAESQGSPPPDFNDKGCRWPVAYPFIVPNDWASGVYIARFTGSTGETADVLFVVKAAAPGSNSKIVLALTVNRAQAYNDWGGTSLYSDPRSVRVSFDRPGGLVETFRKVGEQRFIIWAESNGFELEYCTSIDLHANSNFLDNYQLLLSVGHDEYWSKEMRDNVEAFIANGGNVVFLSGNVCSWQVRFENNDRTMVCYKSDEHNTPPDNTPDPDPDPTRQTIHWWDTPVLRPENSMTGVRFSAGWWNGPIIPDRRLRGYKVSNSSHWVFHGTGLTDGDEFGASNNPRLSPDENVARTILGSETDTATIVDGSSPPVVTGEDGTPGSFVVLGRADLSDWPGSTNVPSSLSLSERDEWLSGKWGAPGSATMGIYQRNGRYSLRVQ
jgi:hypothetical protein